VKLPCGALKCYIATTSDQRPKEEKGQTGQKSEISDQRPEITNQYDR